METPKINEAPHIGPNNGIENPSPEPKHVGHGLSAYPQARFVAAVTGELPLAEYAREASEHVKKQLPRHRHNQQHKLQ
jgi:hypothetical protein